MLSRVACWFLGRVSVVCERAGGWGAALELAPCWRYAPGYPWQELMRHAVVSAQPNLRSQFKTSTQALNFSPYRLKSLILSSASLLATPKWFCQITCSAPSCPPKMRNTQLCQESRALNQSVLTLQFCLVPWMRNDCFTLTVYALDYVSWRTLPCDHKNKCQNFDFALQMYFLMKKNVKGWLARET